MAEDTRSDSRSEEPRNFESTAKADAWFRNGLIRLDALPIVVAYQPDVGYVAETDARQLVALDRAGTPVWLRRRADRAKRPVPANGLPLPEGFVYELAERSREDPSLGAWPRPEEMAEQLLVAFVHPARVDLAPLLRVAIPPKVIRRDFGPGPNEVLDLAHCLLTPSERHCLALYVASDADHLQTRLRVVLYARSWVRLGSTGRTPRNWPTNSRKLLPRFSVVGLYDVRGLDYPVFVTRVFAQRSPCWEHRLHTFLPSGELATVPLPNGTVAGGTTGFCTMM